MKPLSTLAALFAAAASLNQNVLLIAAAGKDGETITIGSQVFELDTGGGITAGRIAVDLSASSAAAGTGTLTTSGNAVAAETVTIAGVVYTWAAAPATANEIKVGATAAESLDNLVAAIMATALVSNEYGAGTVVHPTVTAVRSSATMVVTSKIKGTVANAYGTTETMTNAAWGGSVLSGGVDPTANQTRDAIIVAINANVPQARATAITGGLLFVDSSGRGTKATTETLAGSGNGWLATATFGSDSGGAVPNLAAILQRTVTAAEDTGKVFVMALPATPVAFAVQIRAATGALKTWDGKAVITGNAVILYSDGSADLVENDIVALTFAI